MTIKSTIFVALKAYRRAVCKHLLTTHKSPIYNQTIIIYKSNNH